MKVLVFGGTRFFGKTLVKSLIEKGYDVTIATRGIIDDEFGDKIERIIVERNSPEDMKKNLQIKVLILYLITFVIYLRQLKVHVKFLKKR